MQHHTAVARCPTRSTLALVPHKAVFDPQAVMRIWLLVEKVTKLFAKVFVFIFIVANLQQAILDSKRVAVVIAQVVVADLWRPALEILAVEQLNPFFLSRRVLA